MIDSRVIFLRRILSFHELLFLLAFCALSPLSTTTEVSFKASSKEKKVSLSKNKYSDDTLLTGRLLSLSSHPHSRMFETFSFLPPLSDADLAKQVQYLLNNGWTPCLEFEDPEHAYCDGHGWSGLDSSINANYYDNRYWVMWKLPMYGCNSADEVLAEVKACVKAFPDCYVRCAGFDNIKQVQCHSFLVYRPKSGAAREIADRQV